MLRRAFSKVPSRAVLLTVGIVVTSTSVLAVPIGAAYGENTFTPGNLVVSTSVWTTNANITSGTTQLPPNCGGTTYTDAPCVTAIANGTYPQVFNNATVDGSFGGATADLDRRDHDVGHPGQPGRGAQQHDVRRHVEQRPDDHELLVEVGAGAERLH